MSPCVSINITKKNTQLKNEKKTKQKNTTHPDAFNVHTAAPTGNQIVIMTLWQIFDAISSSYGKKKLNALLCFVLCKQFGQREKKNSNPSVLGQEQQSKKQQQRLKKKKKKKGKMQKQHDRKKKDDRLISDTTNKQ